MNFLAPPRSPATDEARRHRTLGESTEITLTEGAMMATGIDSFTLEVVNDLVVEFSGVLPRPTVMATVLEARQDLDGQIAQEAISEMLYRLAHHRLHELLARRGADR